MNILKFLLIFIIGILLESCQPARMVYHNFASIKDYKIFPKRDIEKGKKSFLLPTATQANPPINITIDSVEKPFDDFLEGNKTVAFLIIRNDSIQYENYFNGYDEESIVASFSMTKSILSMLIGIAVDEGHIHSINDSINDYVSGIKHKKLQNTTIKQLLQMTSSLDFKESYINPFGHAAGFYYGRNLRKKSKRLKIKKNPDYKFDYKSGNSQLLGLVLDNALPKNQTISGYLEEKIWQPLQMEFDASWSTDDEKNEKALERTFCCVNTRARSFVRLGQLYLNKGRFNNTQIIPEEWVEQSTKIDTTGGSSWKYQYQWWLPTKEGDFMADGLLGQYIYVNPEKDLVIVRLGKKKEQNWKKIFPKIAEAY